MFFIESDHELALVVLCVGEYYYTNNETELIITDTRIGNERTFFQPLRGVYWRATLR